MTSTVASVPASITPTAPSPSTAATATATTSPSATPTPTTTATPLKVRSVSNLRDVAGTGLELDGGARMATGVVYRSARLNGLSAADTKALLKAGLAEVIDLRTDYVSAHSPDPAIKGVEHHNVNVFAVPRTKAVTYRTVSAARAHMRQLNLDFVDVAAQRRQIARVLTLIAAADEPVLIHCTEGKDRTGWISAVLQLNAGARREQVMAEYLKSNEFRSELIKAGYQAKLRSSGRTAAQVELALLKVRPEYLDAGLDEVTRRYGDIEGYLTKGLGLTRETVQRLRDRLTA